MQEKLYMGNIDAKRDWGHAKDYVKVMWKMLQVDTPEDFVIATGETRTVREFLHRAFAEVGMTIEFQGSGVDEKGFVVSCSNPKYQLLAGTEVINIDPEYFRPTEVELLIGDATKARTKLNWTPEYSFDDLVKDMMQSDLKLFKRNKQMHELGYGKVVR
jgi:GDPmannose 4,6-dehydratase